MCEAERERVCVCVSLYVCGVCVWSVCVRVVCIWCVWCVCMCGLCVCLSE